MLKQSIARQLAADYCCTPEEVLDSDNHFTEYRPMEGRRMFDKTEDCFLKVAVVFGKILCTGQKEIVELMRERYRNDDGAWFFEAKNLTEIGRMLEPFGYRVEMVHPFYASDTQTPVDTGGYEIVWYDQEEILQFRGNDAYDEAFAFCETAPDMVGVAALRDGTILGMAGASADSPTLWQIGINTVREQEAKGIGSMLVTMMKNEVISRGLIPYYGTSMSHIASLRVAQKAGFLPMWAELITSRIRE